MIWKSSRESLANAYGKQAKCKIGTFLSLQLYRLTEKCVLRDCVGVSATSFRPLARSPAPTIASRVNDAVSAMYDAANVASATRDAVIVTHDAANVASATRDAVIVTHDAASGVAVNSCSSMKVLDTNSRANSAP